MHVLLTGGYGFIGAWIVRHLLQRDDAVFVYDLRKDPRRLRLLLSDEQVERVTFVPGDITDLPALTRAIADCGITHIIHLAGLQVPTCRADPLLGAKVNVLGTLGVFEAARQSRGQVQRIVYASSAAVFGSPQQYPGGRQPDDAKLIPSTHYGVFKCCNEGNARIFFQDTGLSSVGLRPWTVYGVGRDLGMTSDPTKAIKALALGRSFHIAFGGITDFQYAPDVAAAFVRSLDAAYHGARAYNLRGTVVEMAAFHRALTAVEPRASQLITFGTQQIAIAYDLDDTGFQTDLGPLPITPLQTGIRETLERFRQLHAEGRLDTADLDAPQAPPVTVADEP